MSEVIIMELFDTAWVEKRNVLNELRSNNMTVQELRFFSIYLSKINHRDVSTRLVRFPIEDFQRIMGFGRLNMAQLRASTDSLLCKLVHIPDENGRGFRSFQLFKECHLFQDENGEWVVEIDAHDKALPLMFDFKTRYFKYELWNALRLKSSNQVRMYEILKQYEKLGRRELTVTELRALLGFAPNEYSDRTGWSNFKKKVLDSCQQALKETTDICYTYERGKVGKGGKHELADIRNRIISVPDKMPKLSEVSRKMCVSEGHFRLIYRQCFDVSYNRDCINSRVMKACYLLYSTAMSIYATAVSCGYDDEKFFSRQFRQVTGFSPAEYRKKILR